MSSSLGLLKIVFPCSLIATGIALNSSPIKNDSKRDFYKDDEDVTPIPGTIISASATEISALGSNKLVDGISVRSPETLEGYIKSIRHSVVNLLQKTESKVETTTNDYYSTERKVTDTVASLHDKKEDLLPGTLYIGTAFLTGSIAARRSNILFKALAPITFALVAFRFALPSTFEKTAGFTYELEKDSFPSVVNAQDTFVDNIGKAIDSVETTKESTKNTITKGIDSSRKFVSSITGLNLGEDVISKN